mmetsp:Transcript_39923/g.97884  ORF Transcript_39923/g.97884 Transcript_39923/m.97884 type:complete len:213 (-) Transcript_39923:1872-2510(-)
MRPAPSAARPTPHPAPDQSSSWLGLLAYPSRLWNCAPLPMDALPMQGVVHAAATDAPPWYVPAPRSRSSSPPPGPALSAPKLTRTLLLFLFPFLPVVPYRSRQTLTASDYYPSPTSSSPAAWPPSTLETWSSSSSPAAAPARLSPTTPSAGARPSSNAGRPLSPIAAHPRRTPYSKPPPPLPAAGSASTRRSTCGIASTTLGLLRPSQKPRP